MYFEEIILQNGRKVSAKILPEVEIDFDKNEFHAFAGYFIDNKLVKEGKIETDSNIGKIKPKFKLIDEDIQLYMDESEVEDFVNELEKETEDTQVIIISTRKCIIDKANTTITLDKNKKGSIIAKSKISSKAEEKGKIIRIQNLELENFKSIEKLSLDFSDGINVILGANATGKSNILSAIEFALNPDSIYDEDLIMYDKNIAKVKLTLIDENLKCYSVEKTIIGGDKPRIAREVLKGTFKFSPDYKTIEINDTKYDVADFYNKTMIAKNDEKTISMIILHLLYDKSWKEVIEYATLKGLKRK